MNKTTMNFLMGHGYKALPKDSIKNVLKEGYVKGLHIEVTSADTSAFMARVKEKKAIIKYGNICGKLPEYLAVMMPDEFNTVLFSIPINNISGLIVQSGNSITDIIFNVPADNNTYRIIYEN